jgi:hypothetical protein
MLKYFAFTFIQACNSTSGTGIELFEGYNAAGI